MNTQNTDTKINTQINKIADNVQLSTDAKAQLKASVLAYAETMPVRTTAKSPKFNWLPSLQLSPRTATAALLVFVMFAGSGGVAFASQSALPGDRLYGIKLATEDVRERLALSDTAKAELMMMRAERRQAEASTIEQRLSKSIVMRVSPRVVQALRDDSFKRSMKVSMMLKTLEKKNPKIAKRLKRRIAQNIPKLKLVQQVTDFKKNPKPAEPAKPILLVSPILEHNIQIMNSAPTKVRPATIKPRPIKQITHKIRPVKKQKPRKVMPLKPRVAPKQKEPQTQSQGVSPVAPDAMQAIIKRQLSGSSHRRSTSPSVGSHMPDRPYHRLSD